MGKYIACICEGGAERAILDLLLEHHMLIFDRTELLEEEVLSCRKGKEFEDRYLRKGFAEKITVYRIMDSRSENFKLSKAYRHKVDIINVITAPEIEMLIIFSEGRYTDYKREKRKNPELNPSGYCKAFLAHKSVKNYDFVKKYFGNSDKLVNALYEYRRISKIHRGEKTLWFTAKKRVESTIKENRIHMEQRYFTEINIRQVR